MMFIPGRIEVLGKHTDYCGGRSIVCAIDRGFHAEVEPRSDSLVMIENRDSGEILSFDLAELPKAKGHWIDYAIEVGRRLTANFTERPLRGGRIAFRSDLPKAAGLSSSSALMIMVFAALDTVNDLRSAEEFQANIKDDLELAEYLGCIENGQSYRGLAGSAGVGTFGGSQDHAAIMLCRKGRLTRFAFSPLRREAEYEFPDDHTFIVAASGVAAEKTGAALEKYNRLSRMAAEIIAAAGRGPLSRLIREIGFGEVLATIRRGTFSFATQELIDRVEQFRVESEEIIPAVSERLSSGSFGAVGSLIDRSQQNAERLLGNQIDETIFLQRSARSLGAVAASAFGAGFGGSVYAIVKAANAEAFIVDWKMAYAEKFPRHRERCEFFATRPSQISLV